MTRLTQSVRTALMSTRQGNMEATLVTGARSMTLIGLTLNVMTAESLGASIVMNPDIKATKERSSKCDQCSPTEGYVYWREQPMNEVIRSRLTTQRYANLYHMTLEDALAGWGITMDSGEGEHNDPHNRRT